MAAIQGTRDTTTLDAEPPAQQEGTRWSLRPQREAVVPRPPLPGSLSWRAFLAPYALRDELRAPPPRPGGLRGGARLDFQAFAFVSGVGGATTTVAAPARGFTGTLNDAWHNAAVTAVNRLGAAGASRPVAAVAERNDDGRWVVDYVDSQELPGRFRPEPVHVSLVVDVDGAQPFLASLTLTDQAGNSLELPFRSMVVNGPRGPVEVRIPDATPERTLLDLYLPSLPSQYLLTETLAGNALLHVVSDVGLNQDLELDLVRDLTGAYAVCTALLLAAPPVPSLVPPASGTADPPVPTRFKVALNIEAGVSTKLRVTYVGRQILQRDGSLSLSTLVSQAVAIGVVPSYEWVRGGDAPHVWSFPLRTTTLAHGPVDFALKLRVMEVGHGQAEVVDARLVHGTASAVQWREFDRPNANLP